MITFGVIDVGDKCVVSRGDRYMGQTQAESVPMAKQGGV